MAIGSGQGGRWRKSIQVASSHFSVLSSYQSNLYPGLWLHVFLCILAISSPICLLKGKDYWLEKKYPGHSPQLGTENIFTGILLVDRVGSIGVEGIQWGVWIGFVSKALLPKGSIFSLWKIQMRKTLTYSGPRDEHLDQASPGKVVPFRHPGSGKPVGPRMC